MRHVGDLGVGRELSGLVREGLGVGRGYHSFGPELATDYVRYFEHLLDVPDDERLELQPREET